jgi:hypothetical protein
VSAVYAPPDFRPPAPPRTSVVQERVIGLLVLILLLFTCFFFALSADSQVFNPLNTVRPITQTWRAQQTSTPRATRQPRLTPTSRFGGGAVEHLPVLRNSQLSSSGDSLETIVWFMGESRLCSACSRDFTRF